MEKITKIKEAAIQVLNNNKIDITNDNLINLLLRFVDTGQLTAIEYLAVVTEFIHDGYVENKLK